MQLFSERASKPFEIATRVSACRTFFNFVYWRGLEGWGPGSIKRGRRWSSAIYTPEKNLAMQTANLQCNLLYSTIQCSTACSQNNFFP